MVGPKISSLDPRLRGIPLRTSEDNEHEPVEDRDGFVKIYLGHAEVGTVLYPQQIFVNLGGLRFYQCVFFGPPQLKFGIEAGINIARFNVDVAHPRSVKATRLIIAIRSDGLEHVYADGAQLYRCRIYGTRLLLRHAGGRAKKLANGDFALRLHHFTDNEGLAGITSSGAIWASAWNLQGTRKFADARYAYLTSLPDISSDEDLARIAMSADEVIRFQTTSLRRQEEVLELPVLRSSTSGRRRVVSVEVPTALLSAPNLLLHPPVGGMAYYEVVAPEIFRVGLEAEVDLCVEGSMASVPTGGSSSLPYVILGDPSEIEGLAAPYHEGEVRSVMHLEQLRSGTDFFDFWHANRNSDQMTGRTISPRPFSPD